MFKRKLAAAVAVTCGMIGLLAAACDRSDVITGAGSSIINDLDPNLANPNIGMIFRSFGLNENVVTMRSLPDGADPAFSTHAGRGHLWAGLSDDGDTLTAHAQFRVRPFADTDVFETPPYDDGDTATVSAYIFFRFSDTTSTQPPALMNMYLSDDTLAYALGRDTNPNGSITTFVLSAAPVDRSIRYMPNGNGANGNRQVDDCPDGEECTFAAGFQEVTVAAALDSVRLPQSVARKILKTRLQQPENPSDLTDYVFAISVIDYFGELARMREPSVILNVKRNVGGDVRDTLTPVFTRFTAFEDPAVAAERARLPYSSQLTKRTAVFEVNADMILEIENRGELISAIIAMVADINGQDAGADRMSDDPPENQSDIASRLHPDQRFSAVGHHSRIGHEFAENNSLASDSVSLRRLFGAAGTTLIMSPFNTLAVKAPLLRALQSCSRDLESCDRNIYIYIRPSTENSTILWRAPRRIDVSFTRSGETQ